MQTYLNDKIKVYNGDSREVLKQLSDNSIDSIVTDPPYALVSIVKRFGSPTAAPSKNGDVYSRSSAGFMGKQWDTGETAFATEFWEECYRVLKPGGFVLSFGATRSYHRLACAIEDAGFEIRDCIMWVYGCFSEDTQCLTKTGWKFYQDISIEDEILQWDSITNELNWTKPKQIFVYDAPKEMVHLQNRHTDQLLTKNHRVYGKFRTHSRNSKPDSFTVEFAGNIKKHWHKDLPLAGALFSGKREPLAYLIGWWLTDAWLHRDGKACMFSQSKPDTLNKLNEALDMADCNYSLYTKVPQKTTHNVENTFYVTGNLSQYLIDNYSERKLTWEVLNFDNWSRYELLEGLLDGDGSRRETQHAEIFWSKNPEYLDIVQALCVSLNIRSHIDYNKGCVYLNRKTNTTQLQHKHVCENVSYDGDKVWCLETDTGAFVVRRNGRAFISGNSGFPKSHNVSKNIDKKLGAVREKVKVKFTTNVMMGGIGVSSPWKEKAKETGYHEVDSDKPVTDEAKAWDGWGTALKPAVEPIVMARKPLSENSIVDNVLKHGTGAINIDECRVPSEEDTRRSSKGGENGLNKTKTFKIRERHVDDFEKKDGRWPANLIHDGSDEVIDSFPYSKSGISVQRNGGGQRIGGGNGIYSGSKGGSRPDVGYQDEGSNSRFFYSAKASAKEKVGNHPTQKPIALMQYLCRLVTPKGGTVLDPFAGTGTTAEGAWREGFNCVLIEREEEYVDLIDQRMNTVYDRLDTNNQISSSNSIFDI